MHILQEEEYDKEVFLGDDPRKSLQNIYIKQASKTKIQDKHQVPF